MIQKMVALTMRNFKRGKIVLDYWKNSILYKKLNVFYSSIVSSNEERS